MDILEIILLATGLSMDALAVAMCAGTTHFLAKPRAIFRIAFHFGLFQCMMPIIGWFLGGTIESLIAFIDHWIAFAMLAFVGGRMIRTGLCEQETCYQTNPSKGWNLVILSVATSIDAMAVGFSLALIQVSIWTLSVIIGLITGILSYCGIKLGNRLGQKFGKKVEILGGIILIGIGVRILIAHLMAQ